MSMQRVGQPSQTAPASGQLESPLLVDMRNRPTLSRSRRCSCRTAAFLRARKSCSRERMPLSARSPLVGICRRRCSGKGPSGTRIHTRLRIDRVGGNPHPSLHATGRCHPEIVVQSSSVLQAAARRRVACRWRPSSARWHGAEPQLRDRHPTRWKLSSSTRTAHSITLPRR